MSAPITAADVLAFLEAQCAEVIRKTGCACACVSAHARVGEVDHSWFVAHADDVCVASEPSFEVTLAKLVEKHGTPAWRAAHLRAEAKELWDKAEAISPAKRRVMLTHEEFA